LFYVDLADARISDLLVFFKILAVTFGVCSLTCLARAIATVLIDGVKNGINLLDCQLLVEPDFIWVLSIS